MSPHLELLPAVDVADGQAVQLVQGVAGSEKRFGDPVEAALRWQEAGAEWIHLVDLDAAFGRGHNRDLLATIVGRLDVQVELSGGIRDDESLAAAMATGCRRVNIGTAALEQPEWCAAAIAAVGRPGGGRPRRPRPDAGRPRLDPRRRRPLRGARAARRRGLRALRRHRREQGRHAPGPEPPAAAATSAARPTGRSSPAVASPSWTTWPPWWTWCRTASRARSSGPRSTRAASPSRTRSRSPGATRMTLAVRVIPCLDVDAGRVVKGVNFRELRDAGDPVELARRYDAEGADELTFLDISASHEGRATTLEIVSRTAEQVFIPLTVGGGVAQRRRRRPAAARRRRQGGGQHRRDPPTRAGRRDRRPVRQPGARALASTRAGAPRHRRPASRSPPTAAASRPGSTRSSGPRGRPSSVPARSCSTRWTPTAPRPASTST